MTAKIDPEFREWLIKEKLKRSLPAHFLVRFHVLLILAGALAAGWAANRLLYWMDLRSMLVRHPLAIVAAYLGFLLGLQAWIRYSGIRRYLSYRRSKELLEPGVAGLTPPEMKGGVTSLESLQLAGQAGEGCLYLGVLGLLALVVFALGGYLLVFAAELLAEIVFELLLVAGLISGIRRVDLLASVGIPRISLWALAAALSASVLFGLYAREAHPTATTIGEVVKALGAKGRKI